MIVTNDNKYRGSQGESLKLDEHSHVEKPFLEQLIHLGWASGNNEVLELAGTTTIPDLKHRDFYSIPIFFPKDLKEQNEITKIISSSDNVINDYTIELNKLKSIKTGLMQDLLSGKKRVTHLIN